MLWIDDFIRIALSFTEVFLYPQESLYDAVSGRLMDANLVASDQMPTEKEVLGVSLGVAIVCLALGFYQLVARDVADAFYSIPADVRPWALAAVVALALLAIVGNPLLFRQAGEAYFETGLVTAKAVFFFGAFSAGRLAARYPFVFCGALLAGFGAAYGLNLVDLSYVLGAVVAVVAGVEVARFVFDKSAELGSGLLRRASLESMCGITGEDLNRTRTK